MRPSKRIRYALLRWAASGCAALAREMPLESLRRFGNVAGWLLYHLAAKRRRLGERNLLLSFGDLYDARQRRSIACQSAQNALKTMLELLHLPAMTEEEWAQNVSWRGTEHVARALADGRGVILATAHFGNWELMGAGCVRHGWEGSWVVRDAKDPTIAETMNAARISSGAKVLARERVRDMLRILNEGKFLGIIPDQYASTGGIQADFLGRPASTFTGPAVLARRTGAAIIPCFGRRRSDDTLDIQFHPPLELPKTQDREADVRAGTQLLNDVFGEEISKYPEQWLWLDDRWREPRAE